MRESTSRPLSSVPNRNSPFGAYPLLLIGFLYFITRIVGKYSGAWLGCLVYDVAQVVYVPGKVPVGDHAGIDADKVAVGGDGPAQIALAAPVDAQDLHALRRRKEGERRV